MVKRIILLSEVFIKEYFQNLYIFNKNTKKINKKSSFTWLLITIILVIGFFSFKIINYLDACGQGILFLKVYFPILATIFMFQTIFVFFSVFFFSKDLEYILPLPINPIELLIAKFNNVISMIYAMEMLVLLIPLLMYGTIVAQSIIYYFMILILLIIFPVFFVLIISIIMLFVIQFTKFIRNKDVFQILTTIVLTFIMFFVQSHLLNYILIDNISFETANNEINSSEIQELNNRIDKVNSYFITTIPYISLITNFNIFNIFLQLIKLIVINLILFAIFVFLGNLLYVNRKKNNKKIVKNKYKKNKIKKSYLKNEIKKIIKNPTFLLQCIFQYIFIIVALLLIINLFFPTIVKIFEKEDYLNELGVNNFALQCICRIIGIIQIIYALGNISITSISRDGKNAVVMKYIPVSLYKQFLWKNFPQIVINIIPIIGMIVVVAINIPKISILYYLEGIIIAMLLNIINSFLLIIFNLKKPYLDWATEISAIKDNRGKLYQYVITICTILILAYFTKVFKDVNIHVSLTIIIIVLLITLIVLIVFIKKNINKLFEKIY